MSLSQHSEFTIAADHPALAGHFPGHPVVPGVLLLDAALCAVQRWRPQAHIAGLPQVKFLAAAHGGETVRIALHETAPGRIAFDLHCKNVHLVSGQCRVEWP